MPKTIKNKYYNYLSYEKLMEAHLKSRKGKGYRKETILFNLKQEEYIIWLLKKLETKTYNLENKLFYKVLENHTEIVNK